MAPRVDQAQTLPRLAEFDGFSLLGFARAVLYIADPRVLASTQYVVALAGTSFQAEALFDAAHLYQQRSFTVLLPNVHQLVFGWSIAIATLIAAVIFFKLGPEFSHGWLA